MKMDDIDERLAQRLREARVAHGQTLDQLANLSGVSRAMISRIERAESSPTAALLGRLCGGLGITMSSLFVDLEGPASHVARLADQPVWRDPDTGYVRRNVTPAGTGSPQEIVHVRLPAGKRVDYPAGAYAGTDHHILVLDGTLEFGNGERAHRLQPGDCLHIEQVAPCWYRNPGRRVAEYLVLVIRLGRVDGG